jgi:hypothetical protein
MHLHYEILLRPTSPEVDQKRKRENDLKSSRQKEKKKRMEKVMSVPSSNILSFSLLSTILSCHKESASI